MLKVNYLAFSNISLHSKKALAFDSFRRVKFTIKKILALDAIMKTIFSTLLLFVGLSSSVFAEYYSDSALSGDLTDNALRADLQSSISKGHTSLGYKGARRYLFGDLDLKKDEHGDYYVKDVYCEQIFDNDDFSSSNGLGPMQIPDSNVLNCEHTWPQSRFVGGFSNEMQKSDLHHLFSTSSKANSVRGNNPFAEVSYGQNPMSGCTTSEFGKANKVPGADSTSSIYFEPPDFHKGNVARALFYFSVRYSAKIDPVQEYYFRKWHAEDPVDQEERDRNDRINEVQGNRNPFIDHPEFVERISDF